MIDLHQEFVHCSMPKHHRLSVKFKELLQVQKNPIRTGMAE
jgi:hypothetical protein